MPHASIGTDVIAGFPGETDADADESERAVEALPLSYLHVFPYSDRPGTAAAAMTPKVAPERVKARAARMRDIGARSVRTLHPVPDRHDPARPHAG